MPNARYREICVEGTPRSIGRQIGEAAGEEIRGFIDVALQRVNKTISISRPRALAIANRSADCGEQYSPAMMDELRGMAESAHVSLQDLMLLQVRNQLRAEPDAAGSDSPDSGCTSLSFRNVHDGHSIVAQNWDNDPALDPFTIVLTRKPTGKLVLMNITQAGLIAYIGFNDAGIGLCLNTLPAPSREVGVPHYFTVRGIYEATSLSEAIDAVRRAARAIPANIMLATPTGPADLEVTIDDVFVLADPTGITHTNHCLDPRLTHINERFPELIESYPRQQRIVQLVGSKTTDLSAIQSALRDHDGYPRSICRHTNDDPQTGFWQTVFSVVIEPDKRRMHIARGTPCDREYETYVMP